VRRVAGRRSTGVWPFGAAIPRELLCEGIAGRI
jgi:hypothetical protein